jgi:MipA family protein
MENAVSRAPLVFILSLFIFNPAVAQEPAADTSNEWFGSSLQGQVGAMGMFAPSYEGSDEHKFAPFPMIDLTWNERVFLTTRDGLGAYAISTENFKLGGAVNYSFGRDEEDVDLNGIGGVDGGIAAAAVAKFNYGPFFLGSNLSHQMTGDDTGFLLTLSGGSALPVTEDLMLMATASLQAADDAYMESYFGVSNAEALAGGVNAYEAEAGLKSVGLSVGATYNVTGNWNILALGSYTRLVGDAADSPYTKDENQFMVGAGLVYQFGPKPSKN